MNIHNTTKFDDKLLVRITHEAIKFWAKKINVPFTVRHIREAQFRNREEGTSGRAWWRSSTIRIATSRFCVSLGFKNWTCHKNCKQWCGKFSNKGDRCHGENNLRKGDHSDCDFKYIPSDDAERLRQCVRSIAHEVGHLAVHYAENFHGRRTTRANGASGGGDEEYIDRMAWKFTDEFWPKFSARAIAMTEKFDAKQKAAEEKAEAKVEARKAKHQLAVAAKAAVPKITVVEKRQLGAIKGVARWLGKIDKAERDLKNAKKKLKEYERKVKYYAKRNGK